MCAFKSLTCLPQVAMGHKPLLESSEESEPWLFRECTEEIEGRREPSNAG